MSETINVRGSVPASGPLLTFSSEIMVAAIIFFFIAIAFVVFVYLYAKHYWIPDASLRSRSRALFVFTEADPAAPFTQNGLDANVLSALPVTIFSSAESKDKLECSVCLCELSDGEQVRMLPKCNHGFHLRCIDIWFHSHSTCPLCRSAVGILPAPSTLPAEPVVRVSSAVALPTNLLFWGTHDRVTSTAAEQASSSLVIDVPRRAMEPMSTDLKTPPTSARLRSLRRLLSQGKRAMVGGSSTSSPRGDDYDIEQGENRSALTTPRSTPAN